MLAANAAERRYEVRQLRPGGVVHFAEAAEFQGAAVTCDAVEQRRTAAGSNDAEEKRGKKTFENPETAEKV